MNWSQIHGRAYAVLTGRLIRATRLGLGLTLADVEKLGGIHRTVLASYERGDRAITVETLARIAAVLGVSVVDLLPADPRATETQGPIREAVCA